jgi:15-cis-phytoene synthase
MTETADLDHCRAAIRTGSLSFHAASRLLPANIRDPALVLYAFCRHADDEVDEGQAKAAAVLRLRDRLDLVYAGRPANRAEDRAFARVVAAHDMPKALPEALLEGLAWDAQGRQYQTLSDVRAYSARVAAAVGAMMCVLMGARSSGALARACDLGVAMQLTNIARDVGEDARAGRLYLPLHWLAEAGIDPDQFLRDPQATPAIRRMVARLLSEADRLYLRSQTGITALPFRARPGIWAARFIYAAIGDRLRAQDLDSVTRRARTGRAHKLAMIGRAGARSLGGALMPQSAVLFAPPLEEVRWLVDAAAVAQPWPGRTRALIDTLADLGRADALGGGAHRA